VNWLRTGGTVRLFDDFRLLIPLSGGKRTLRQSHDQFRCGMPVILFSGVVGNQELSGTLTIRRP